MPVHYNPRLFLTIFLAISLNFSLFSLHIFYKMKKIDYEDICEKLNES